MSHTLTLDQEQLRILEVVLDAHVERTKGILKEVQRARWRPATEPTAEPLVNPVAAVVTVPTHWDCDCPNRYIHAKADRLECPLCGQIEADSPDSRPDEVADPELHFVAQGEAAPEVLAEIQSAAPEVLVEQPFGTGMALNLLKQEPETVVPEAAPEAPATPVVPVTKKSPEKAVSKDPGEISMAGLGVGLPKASERKAKPLEAQGIDAMVDKFKRDFPQFNDIPIPKLTWRPAYTPDQLIRCVRALSDGVPAREAGELSQLSVADARAIASNWLQIVVVLKALPRPKRTAALDDLEAIQKARVNGGLLA